MRSSASSASERYWTFSRCGQYSHDMRHGASRKLNRAFPHLATFIDGAYQEPVAIGSYRVRLPRR